MDDLLNNLVKSVTTLTLAIDKKHTKERRRLVQMDIKDLRATMPHLTIFHDDLREKTKERGRNEENVSKDTRNYKYYHDSDSDDSIKDMPVDYKISDLLAMRQ